MRPLRISPLLRLPFAAALVVCLALLVAGPAEADIGVDRVNPRAGSPGESVAVSLGCGFCLAASVVRGPLHPPAAFSVSLVSVERAPRPRRCGENNACGLTSLGPPRERPFVFLGLAKPTFRERDLENWQFSRANPSPEYRLRFRIPTVEPGAYAYVIYCGGCLPGPRGSLIVDTVDPRDGLRVRPEEGTRGVNEDAAPVGPWTVGAAVVAILALTACWLLFRRRPAG